MVARYGDQVQWHSLCLAQHFSSLVSISTLSVGTLELFL